MNAPADPLAAVTHSDPYPYYASLVAQRPLYRDGSIGMWVASSATAVHAVLTSGLVRVRPPDEPVPRTLVGTAAGEIFRHMVRMNDGAGHGPMKEHVSAHVSSLSQSAAPLAARYARDLAGAATAHASKDVAGFASRLAVYTLASLLGAEHERLPGIAAAIGDFAAALAPCADAEALAAGNRAARDLATAFAPLGNTDAQVANAVALMFQGYDASAALVGNTLVALSAQRLGEALASDRNLLSYAIDEVVRFDSPVQNTRRWLAADGDIAGVPMRAGDGILVVIAAANRDPNLNAEPDRFDLFRKDRRSFTFGAGVHACPGEMLAKTIARAAVEALLEAGLALDGLTDEMRYRLSPNTRVPLFAAASRAGRGLPSF